MTTLSDAIRAVVGGTSINDGLMAYYAANGGVGTTLPDLERSFLISQLGLSAPVAATTNDMWRRFLTGAGFTGAPPDQLLQFWLAGGAVSLESAIRALFANGEQGAWYDPSDFSTMFQDSAGTTPVTAVEQPVGLMLDKRLPATLTVPLDAMAFMPAGSTPPTAADTTFLSEVCGSVTFPANTGGYSVSRAYSSKPHPIVLGRHYTHSYRIALSRALTSGETLAVYTTGTNGTDSVITLDDLTPSGVWVDFVNATVVASAVESGENYCVVYANSAIASPITIYVRQYTVKEIPGNHALQTTAASRPVLSARKNLLVSTEDFANAAWAKSGATVTANADGTSAKIVRTAGTVGLGGILQASGNRAGAFSVSARVKAAGYDFVAVTIANSVGRGVFSLATNTYTDYGGVATGSVVDDTDGYKIIKFILADAVGGGPGDVYLSPVNANIDPVASWTSDGTSGIFVTWVQTERSPAPTTYQRVTTATDYDTVGFPRYWKLDGVDDSAATAAGGGATTSAVIVMGFHTDAIGAAQTLFSDRSGNTGLKLEITAGGNIAFSGGNGASINTATGAAVAANTDYVVTAYYDGTNLSVQLNNGTATTAACALSAGTAAITFGKDNGAASGFRNGREYQTIYLKNVTKSAGEIASAKSYVAAKCGVTL